MARIEVQISLEADEYSAVKREAERLGVSVDEAIRCQLRELLDDGAPGSVTEDPFFAMIGMLKDETAPDLSTHHDAYLYGAELH